MTTTTTYFKEVKNLEDLKVQYKKLAFMYHPDIKGIEFTKNMQDINAEYEILFNSLKNEFNNNPINKNKQKTETSTMYTDFINKIIHLKDIEVEICGTWIWISGETKPYKELLKKLKCRWAKKKSMWYFRTEEYKSFNRKSFSMDQIRQKYGSEKVNGKPFKPLTD